MWQCSSQLDIGAMVECEEQYDQCYKAVLNCHHQTFHLRGCSNIKRLGGKWLNILSFSRTEHSFQLGFFYRLARDKVNKTDCSLMSQCRAAVSQCWQIIWWFTSLSGSDVLDDDISDSVFGTKSGKSAGRKFYWDGPIEVELPNKVERSLINIDQQTIVFTPIFSVLSSDLRISKDEKLWDKRTVHG